MMIPEAFQYPTRLGRTARCAGRLFFIPPDCRKREKREAAWGGLPLDHLLLRPPRLPSMLRFRSAIFPSEEERNCLSLSSKDWSAEGGSVCCGLRA